ncbi:4658_t:CDS:2, partial [Dentiscutata erythropus]
KVSVNIKDIFVVSTLRQCRNREQELPKKRREHISNNQNRKLKKKAAEECEKQLACDQEQKCQKAEKNTTLLQKTERPVIAVTIETTDETKEIIVRTFATISRSDNFQSEENIISVPRTRSNIIETNVKLLTATTISEFEHKFLQKFQDKINKL